MKPDTKDLLAAYTAVPGACSSDTIEPMLTTRPDPSVIISGNIRPATGLNAEDTAGPALLGRLARSEPHLRSG